MGCHTLLQGIFPTQGSNSGPLHCRHMLTKLSHQKDKANGRDVYMVCIWGSCKAHVRGGGLSLLSFSGRAEEPTLADGEWVSQLKVIQSLPYQSSLLELHSTPHTPTYQGEMLSVGWFFLFPSSPRRSKSQRLTCHRSICR